ncbi:MAG: APC family permease [Bdellovibrionales bacterium]|nr:APC family permease [Bdellovibrionales bacterium]
MGITGIKRLLLGRPLANAQASEEKIPKWKALAVLSSDALSSTAYATEEILIPLAAFGALALTWSVPVAFAIVSLMVIVTLSYRQTIQAYPNGGGAYVVANENLGPLAGLTAGAALLFGYLLTVAVSVAAGVGAVTSAFPEIAEHRVLLGGAFIAILTWLNLRGVRESATFFAYPTYVFIFSLLALIGFGAWRIASGDVPHAAPILEPVSEAVPLFLILRAFSSGCAALTGIEAISNGVPAFKHPSAQNARTTLVWMTLILGVMFLGITAVSHAYGITPQAAETSISQLARSVFGTGPWYYLIQVATALILILAANTSYNGLPWLAAVLARDRYLPRQLAVQGDRLVFSNSILWLSGASFILLALFGGDAHSLIPLYAVGVFLGFTLSQAGMVVHHRRERQPGWRTGLALNLLGAVTTGVVFLVVGVTKFQDGAWIVALVVPLIVALFRKIHLHYLCVGEELTLSHVDAPPHLAPMRHTAVVPVSGVHRGVIDALRYALSITDDVRAVYVEIDAAAADRMQKEWMRWGHDIPLVILKSPYRSVIGPLIEYLDDLEQTATREAITVIIPEFVTRVWWHNFLHNQTAFMIRAALLFRRGKVITSVRYHLRAG